MNNSKSTQQSPSVFGMLHPYMRLILVLILLALASNALTLWIPLIIRKAIDIYTQTGLSLNGVLVEFVLAAVAIFVLTYLQSIVQTFVSEKVARDLRRDLSAKISENSFASVQRITPSKLLTNLTSDIDSVKLFVAQAIVSIVSSVFIIIGVSVLLLIMDWKLALVVLSCVPIIGLTFFFVLKKVQVLFLKTRTVIDWLNKVINESILGAALIRVLHSEKPENKKFEEANAEARKLGLQILNLFASMIPVIMFVSNMAVLAILVLGGHFVIQGYMTLGSFAAFYSYVMILIFPILVIGFMSNIIAQAQASYGRVVEVLNAIEPPWPGKDKEKLKGNVAVVDVSLLYGEKPALKNVSLTAKAGTKTAILGPTAAGKTQLLHALIGLIEPNSGTIEYDNKNIHAYEQESLHQQIGFVFQDSIIFNMSVRENIAFNKNVTDKDFQKAIDTAELQDFIATLPQGLDTIVSERGSSLSGGQKQRIMLARALVLNPRILLLDDFTARVDSQTEEKILGNISTNYPDLTLISVTQKIASVKNYDQIILLMEGEIIASGKHKHLLATSPEYAQIYNSQQSVSNITE